MTVLKRGRGLLTFHAVSVIDQGTSSVTNLIAVLVVAQVLDAKDFGVFSLLYSGLTLLLGLSRAFFGIPISIGAREDPASLKALFDSSFSAVVILAIPICLSMGMVGIFSVIAGGGSSSAAMLVVALGVATPLALLQDVGRYYAIASGRPLVALISDALWLVLLAPAVWLGLLKLELLFVSAWVFAIVASLVLIVLWLKPSLSLRPGLNLLKPGRGLRESAAATVLFSSGTTLVVGFLVTPVYGAAAVGSLRGAGTLFGPVNTLITFLDFGILSRLTRQDRSKDVRSAGVVAVALCGVALAWWAFLLWIPERFGTAVLGETWAGARRLLPATGIEYFFLAFVASMVLVLKLRRAARPLFVNKIISSAAIVAGAFVVVLFRGPLIGVSLGMAFGALIGAVAAVLSVRASAPRDPRLEGDFG
jgi:O-antigen/teichoic acid export membrane protein